MFESEDNEYTITKSILDRVITFEELDECLDHIIDSKNESEMDEDKVETCYHYVLQLFYRSKMYKISTTEVWEKINELIGGRIIKHMQGMGLVDDGGFNKNGEYVYSLTKKGLDIAGEPNEDNL